MQMAPLNYLDGCHCTEGFKCLSLTLTESAQNLSSLNLANEKTFNTQNQTGEL